MNKTTLGSITFGICLAVLLVVVLLVSNNKKTPSQDTLKIGFGLGLTGWSAPFGEEFKRGAEVAQKELLESGKKVDLVFEDTEFDSTKAVTVVNKLISLDKVDAVAVTAQQESLSVWNITDSSNIPLLVLWDSSPLVDSFGEKVFATGPWMPASGVVSAQLAKELGAKKAALFGYNQEWSNTVSDGFKKEFEKGGGTIVAKEMPAPGLHDYKSSVTNIVSAKPDVIYVTVEDLTVGVKQLRQAGYTGPIINSDMIDSQAIKDNPGLFEGVYTSQVADPVSPETDHFIQLYKKYFNEDPKKIVIGAWGYDAVMIYYSAFNKKGSEEKDGFIKNMYGTDYKGASGHIKFSSEGSSKTIPQMFVVKDSQIVKVK